MSKFVFVEKINELPWWVRPEWPYVYVYSASDKDKYDIRLWIETNCEKEVIVFGRTRWPKQGEGDWGSVVSGDGSVDIYFECSEEAAMFKLAWGSSELPKNQRVYA